MAPVAASALLHTPIERPFERLTSLTARMLRAPVSLVTVVVPERQFFKSAVGLSEAMSMERPLTHSLCQYAVETGEPLVVEDAREHPDLSANGAVTDDALVAYLGIPLTDAGGRTLGTLCVWDTQPRQWTRGHVQTLQDLARLVMQRIGAGSGDTAG